MWIYVGFGSDSWCCSANLLGDFILWHFLLAGSMRLLVVVHPPLRSSGLSECVAWGAPECLCLAVQVLTVTLESLSCNDAMLPVPLGPRTESSLLSFIWRYGQVLEAEKQEGCFSRC